jgi:hypothetical protein
MSKVENTHVRLKTARMAAGFNTATEFCNKFQVPISTYNMHETGRRKLMPDIAEKYSELLVINPAWLLTGIGSPYMAPSESSEDNSSLTEEEYFNLLNYKGNQKLPKKNLNTNVRLNQVDPVLFCKIIIEITNTLKEHAVNLDVNLISNHAVEIYNDIIQTSSSHEDQLTMVSLAMTIFKKQLHEQDVSPISYKKVMNK